MGKVGITPMFQMRTLRLLDNKALSQHWVVHFTTTEIINFNMNYEKIIDAFEPPFYTQLLRAKICRIWD